MRGRNGINQYINMKTSEIKVGATYSRGTNVRKVLAAGPQYKHYSGQTTTDNIQFEVIKADKNGERRTGTVHNTTRAAFAAWAQEEVKTKK